MFDLERPRAVIAPFADRQRWFVRCVATVDDNELDCSTALDLLSQAAEADSYAPSLDGPLADAILHAHHCRHCADVFHTLVELMDMEHAGSLPEIDALLHEVRDVVGWVDPMLADVSST